MVALIFGLVAAPSAFAPSPTNPIDALVDDPRLRGSLASIYVGTLDGRTVYERNPDLRAVPASNQKLLSVAYALHTLGPEHRPVTRFWRTERTPGQVSITVDASGDPTLTTETIAGFARRLGIGEGSPRIPIFVRQAYRVGVPPTWEHDDLPFTYAPRITAWSVDRGRFSVVASGGRVDPPDPGLGLRLTVLPGATRQVEVDPMARTLTVRGPLPEERTVLGTFAAPQPDVLAASLLGGPMIATESVPDMPPTLEHRGPPVGDLAAACLVPSDNFIAEALMLMAAAKEAPLGPNPYSVAPNRMRRFLTQVVGLPEGSMRPADGSGMSRHNFVTSRGIADLLRWAKTQPWGELWEASMAAPGRGTLAGRLQGSTFRGKTGTLSAVVGLSGYVTGSDGETYVVSIILNHFLAASAQMREIADQIVRVVEKSPPGAIHALSSRNAESVPDAGVDPFAGHRLHRPARNGHPAPSRVDPGTEPAHAAADRAERVAVRGR
ncbi:MAG: D-alanyl-D-alanine carboxypeptidase [Fimbriimonadaceae bacterium]